MAHASSKTGLIAALALLLMPGAAAAAVGSEPELVQGGRDLSARMTVPVTIGGGGPYHFVVDTAAERTVLSRELATRLSLSSGGQVTILSIAGLSRADTARVPQLQLTQSRSRLSDLKAPLMDEVDLGAAGLLGIDSLQTKRVVMDFKAMRMSISDASRPAKLDSDEIVVTAKRRLGQLILVDASADGQKIAVIIDTGSAVTIGNPMLRARLEKRGKLAAITPISIVSVTGARLLADYTAIAHARIGSVTIDSMPVAFADVELFHRLGLSKKPALLLGMDVLRGFDRVSIDFANKNVRFLLQGDAWQVPPPMLASATDLHAS